MADSSIGLSPAVAGGDTLDAELLDGKKREVIVIGGDDASAEQADVRNAAPGAGDYGLVTRNIPSGTQTVAGTMALDGPTLAALETISVANFPVSQPVTGPLTDAQLRATAVPVSGTVTVGNQPADPATQTTLAAILVELGQKLEPGQEVALDAATLAALETITVLQGTSPWVVGGTITANLGTIDGAATEATLALLKTRADLLATEAKLEAVRALLAGTLAVTGPLTDAQLRATRVPVDLDRAGTLGLGVQTAVSSVAVQLIAANAARRVLIVQNVGLSALRFGGAGVTAATGALLSSAESVTFTMPDTPTNAIWAIRSTATDTTAFAMEF